MDIKSLLCSPSPPPSSEVPSADRTTDQASSSTAPVTCAQNNWSNNVPQSNYLKHVGGISTNTVTPEDEHQDLLRCLARSDVLIVPDSEISLRKDHMETLRQVAAKLRERENARSSEGGERQTVFIIDARPKTSPSTFKEILRSQYETCRTVGIPLSGPASMTLRTFNNILTPTQSDEKSGDGRLWRHMSGDERRARLAEVKSLYEKWFNKDGVTYEDLVSRV